VKLELPSQKKLVHDMALPIRWGDMDAMGHSNIAGDQFGEYLNSEGN